MFDSYITKDFYRTTYTATNPITDDGALDKAIFDASRIIDELTFEKATLFDNLTSDERLCIQYAVCAQIDYIEGLGYNPIEMSHGDYIEGFSVGKYNASSAEDKNQKSIDGVADKARMYLRKCNLTKNGFSEETTINWNEGIL